MAFNQERFVLQDHAVGVNGLPILVADEYHITLPVTQVGGVFHGFQQRGEMNSRRT